MPSYLLVGSNGQLRPLLQRLQGCDFAVRDVGGHKVQQALQDHLRAIVHEVLLGGQLCQVILLREGTSVMCVAQYPLPFQTPEASRLLSWPCSCSSGALPLAPCIFTDLLRCSRAPHPCLLLGPTSSVLDSAQGPRN